MTFPTDWSTRQTSTLPCKLISTNEAKVHLRITGSAFDSAVNRAIEAATQQVEHDTDRALRDTTFEMSLMSIPSGPIPIKQKPLQSVESVRVWNGSAFDELDPSAYSVEPARRWLIPTDGNWSGTSDGAAGPAMYIDYTIGYGDTNGDVPQLFIQAILLQVGRWFNDPMMERSESYTSDAAYKNLIDRLLRTSYP